MQPLRFCSGNRLAMIAAMLLSIQGQGLLAGDGTATSEWVNVTEAFTQQIGVHDLRPDYMRRCVGMIVVPNGDVLILTTGKGVCISTDQGATWAVVEGNRLAGRCESGFGFSVSYPYDGRLAFFSIDGASGISLDGAKTWRPFTPILRNFEFADVDWSAKNPQTIFGLLHEPFYTVLSTDGGSQWRQLYKDAEASKDGQKFASRYCLGLIDAATWVRAHPSQDGISMSTDAGKTWSEVANYKVLGRRPVHYGKKVFWTTAEGVIVSTSGRDWTLTGKGPANAVYGPFFGASDQEFMVVSDKAFFLTKDGGKTWKDVAPTFYPPEAGWRGNFASGQFSYFGWDPKHNIIYASRLGCSVYQWQLK